MDFSLTGVAPFPVLLPGRDTDLRFWPVIAVDQFTSQPEVWIEAEARVGSHPSTLRMVLPEAFLAEGEAETKRRTQAALHAMEDYLGRGVLQEAFRGMVLTERTTASGCRPGLLLCADLEAYDYAPGSRLPIRATEETVFARIPPRLKLREQALVELSHALLLADDPMDSLIGPFYAARNSLPPLYDIALTMGGGRLRGWKLSGEEVLSKLLSAFLAHRKRVEGSGMLFAVGDGNHSLAAAKAAWQRVRADLSASERQGHPARFAMAELINLHSSALRLEPIHRALFGIKEEGLLSLLAPLRPSETEQAPDLRLVTEGRDLPLRLALAPDETVLGALQPLLDREEAAGAFAMDYIHGEEEVRRLARERSAVGILLPPFQKADLFPLVEKQGRLPKKSFSLGDAHEKRFYMECRRLR